MVTISSPRVTRADSGPSVVGLKKNHQVDIVAGDVAGGPLIIKFREAMLRDPEPGGGDVVFGVQGLAGVARAAWDVVRAELNWLLRMYCTGVAETICIAREWKPVQLNVSQDKEWQ